MRHPYRPGGLAGLGVAAALLAAACARQAAPPGGPPDARPPVVVATIPGPMADVPDFAGPVRFEFDERISEQTAMGSLDEVVTVSPRTGDVRVSQGRRSLSVEVDGGFVSGVVYRVTLLAAVQDMFGNTLRDPFDLVFTTGADAVPTVVAGEVWDRVTGAPMSGLAVQAVGADSLPYVGVTDADGIYALRYLPGGAFELRAFEDVNRDHALDRNEPRGLADLEIAAGDTTFVDVSVLAPDTTAAVLGSAQPLDSVTLALSFDDFLDPATPLDSVEVSLESDSASTPSIARLFHEAAYAVWVDAAVDSLARSDSLARAAAPPGDSAAAAGDPAVASDTLGAPDTPAPPDPGAVTDSAAVPDSLARARTGMEPPAPRGPPRLDGAAAGPTRRGRTLPGRRIVVLLDAPLPLDVPFEVVVRGVVNMNGVPEGGGTVTVVRPLRAPDDASGPPDEGEEPAAGTPTGPPGVAPPPDTLRAAAALGGCRR